MKFYASFQITVENCLNNRAINYGDGVFETMLVCHRKIPLWDFHYQRLVSSLAHLHINPIAKQFVYNKIMSLIADNESYVAKLVVFRNDAQRGYASQSSDARYFIMINPYNACAIVNDELTVSTVRLGQQRKLAGLKHLNRLEQVMAAQELVDSKYNDAIMLDIDDNIIETISKNIILVKNNILYTPKLDSNGVYGVALRWLQGQGYKLNWKKIEFKSLTQYHGLIVCNSVQGFVNIKNIDGIFQFKQNLSLIKEIKLKWNRKITSK